jgi:hypothetical protein
MTGNGDMDVWDCLAADEPGGIVLRILPLLGPKGRRIRMQVFRYRGDDLWPGPDKIPEIFPEADGIITLDAFARAVYTAAADALAREGITGLSHKSARDSPDNESVESLSSVRNTLNIWANKRHRPRQMSQPLAVSAVSFVGHAIRFTMGLTPHIILCESMCGDNNHGYESTT